ncbi:MAG TPA: hypothetical protein VK142_02780 [Bacillota bacterium]|nr:hypothetical protein [Bacillota bacterium]
MADRRKIKIDREKETRTEGISKMINEGGLGADKYYNIVKHPTSEKVEHSDETEKEG